MPGSLHVKLLIMYYFKNQSNPFGMFPHGWEYFSRVEGVFLLEGKIIDVMGHHFLQVLCNFVPCELLT